MDIENTYIKSGVDRFIFSPPFTYIRNQLLTPKILDCFFDNNIKEYIPLSYNELKNKFEINSGLTINPPIIFERLINSIVEYDQYIINNKKTTLLFTEFIISNEGIIFLKKCHKDENEYKYQLDSFFTSTIKDPFYIKHPEIIRNTNRIPWDEIFLFFTKSLEYIANYRILQSDLIKYWGSIRSLNIKTFTSVEDCLRDGKITLDLKKKYIEEILENIIEFYENTNTFVEINEKRDLILAYIYYNKLATIIFENPAIHEILITDLLDKLFYCDTNALISLVTHTHQEHHDMYRFSSYLKEISIEKYGKSSHSFLNLFFFNDTIEELKAAIKHSQKIYEKNRLNSDVNISTIRYFNKLPVFYIDFLYGKWNNWNKYKIYISNRFNKIKHYSKSFDKKLIDEYLKNDNLLKEELSDDNISSIGIKNIDADPSIEEFVVKNINLLGKNNLQKNHDIRIVSKIIQLRIEEFFFVHSDILKVDEFLHRLHNIDIKNGNDMNNLIYTWFDNQIKIENQQNDPEVKEKIVTILNRFISSFNLCQFEMGNKNFINNKIEILLIPTNRNFVERLFKDFLFQKCSPTVLPKTWLISFDKKLLEFANNNIVKKVTGHYPICIGHSALKRMMWPYMTTYNFTKCVSNEGLTYYIPFGQFEENLEQIYKNPNLNSPLYMYLYLDNLNDKNEYN